MELFAMFGIKLNLLFLRKERDTCDGIMIKDDFIETNGCFSVVSNCGDVKLRCVTYKKKIDRFWKQLDKQNYDKVLLDFS